jgi:hypothetical protein
MVPTSKWRRPLTRWVVDLQGSTYDLEQISLAHKGKLRTRKCSTTILHPLNNSVEILKVFPNKPVYAWVLWNGLIRVVNFSVRGRWSLDRYIVDVRDGDMGDFCLQDEGNIVMEDRNGVGATNREGHSSEGTKGGLESGVVPGGFCYQSLVITYVEIQHSAACTSAELLC